MNVTVNAVPATTGNAHGPRGKSWTTIRYPVEVRFSEWTWASK